MAVNNTTIVKNSGSILLECVPIGVSLEDVKHDLEKVAPPLFSP
jgi:zinc transporter 1